MSSVSFFRELLNSVFQNGLVFSKFNKTLDIENSSIGELCEELLSTRGEASGIALASAILQKYNGLDAQEKEDFFRFLTEDFDIDIENAEKSIGRYKDEKTYESFKTFIKAVEPRRQELMRRLNAAPGGTTQLVQMRADLSANREVSKECARLDADFQHLFNSWFNKGFLVLRRIDWTTPAHILEKIIKYEAVHEIGSWDELRSRLEPEDRRCFAFFHPAIPDDPLIFVEIALTQGIATSIQDVLSDDRDVITEDNATTAIFYSISNCQKGLKGVSFGNFLIKQVAMDLAAEMPNLKNFATLSPIPGFMRWLKKEAESAPSGSAAGVYDTVRDLSWLRDEKMNQVMQKTLMSLASKYFLEVKNRSGKPVDPVARFHLGNGASLRQINWLADISSKGLEQSAGLMVNYLYELKSVEENHEAYVCNGEVKTTNLIKSMLPEPEAETIVEESKELVPVDGVGE